MSPLVSRRPGGTNKYGSVPAATAMAPPLGVRLAIRLRVGTVSRTREYPVSELTN
ncbi:hypothetical protein ACQKK5_08090 [Brevibacillus panacihumi]|uniref:hypothetical protein n=1 Tax=Brevibacillus panacihumi TaxID=497735 RepID=UPI003D03F340